MVWKDRFRIQAVELRYLRDACGTRRMEWKVMKGVQSRDLVYQIKVQELSAE